MDFKKSGLPPNPMIEKAFAFARRQPMKQAWSELRGRVENDADIALDAAKILLATVTGPVHDLVAGHLAGWALPPARDFYGAPVRANMQDLTKQGLSAAAAQTAREIQNFRFDNPEFPRCNVRVSPSAHLQVRLSCLAAATFHLECLMQKYGSLKAGEQGKIQLKNGVTVRKTALNILQDELARCDFRNNLAFLGTTGQPRLENRYKKALEAVEKRVNALKPPPPAPPKPAQGPPAHAFNRNASPKTPEEELAALNTVLRNAYYKGPYNTYMAALRAKMAVRRKMQK